MYALVNTDSSKVIQLAEKTFTVHPTLEWVDLGDNKEEVARGHKYADETFKPPAAKVADRTIENNKGTLTVTKVNTERMKKL